MVIERKHTAELIPADYNPRKDLKPGDAEYEKLKLSSEVGFRGICRKVLIFFLVGVANILDVQVIGTGSVLRTAIIFFYLSNEGVSLVENAAHLGLPVPEKLKAVLEQLHDRAEKGGDGE